MKKLVIFGNGQVADIMFSYFQKSDEYKVVAFCVDDKFKLKKKHLTLPLLPFSKLKKLCPVNDYFVFVAISYAQMNQKRKDKYNQLKKIGYRFANFINSKLEMPSNVKIGENVAILDSKCIQPFANIHNNVFIWNGTIVGHHTLIKSHSWITSGANIGGNSIIGEQCFLGLNSTVGNMTKIGKNCFLGANSLITKNLANNKVCINKDTSIFELGTSDFTRLTKFK
jgi:sugar O-acyltransferase (sialic acid O-acetyltransferase NeuD family)